MNWKEQLYHHEEMPPLEAWNRIAETIESDPVDLRRRLGDWETAPPEEAWHHIQDSISKPVIEAPVKPMRKPVWRYWVAAAAVIGLGIGLYQLVSGPEGSLAPKVATSLFPSDSPIRKEGKSPPTTQTPAPAGNTPKATIAATAETDAGHPHIFKEYHAPGAEVSYDDGNYIRVKARDGRSHRVSYKCVAMIPCLVKSAPQQDQRACEADLDKWARKLGTSGFIPSPDNFFDIAGMASMLESAR
jgi:hypothetical protein